MFVLREMAPSEAQLLTIFSKFDTDGSGKIDMAELQKALESGGKKVSQEELMKIVELVDKDNDGEIDFEEFKEVFKMSPDMLPAGLKEIFDVSNMFLNGARGAVDAVVLKPTALVTDTISSGFNSLVNSPRASPHGSRAGSPKGGAQPVVLLPPKLELDGKGATGGPSTPVKASAPSLTVEANDDSCYVDPAIMSNAAGYVDEQIVALLSPLQPGEAEELLVRLLGAMPHLATTVRELRASNDAHGTDASPTGAAAEAAAMGASLSAGTLHELELLMATADGPGALSGGAAASSSSSPIARSFVSETTAVRLTEEQLQTLSAEDKIDEVKLAAEAESAP